MQLKKAFLWTGATGLLLAVLAVVSAYMSVLIWVEPTLPSIDNLREVQLQVPLRIYSRDGKLIAEFGEKRREPVAYADVPERMTRAFLAAEDDRFFEHPGVDYQGLLRAGIELVTTGEKRSGGSTITMQVARNYFLSKEKTYLRKLSEIMLALRIERDLSKEEILELYLNKIYLGHRSYGVVAAAQTYFGANPSELTLAQTAMIAGLPKAPSRYNPVTNPERAQVRRNYVLTRMRLLGFIDDNEFNFAKAEPVTARLHGQDLALEAPYVAEMARADAVERFGGEVYTSGYRIYTTIDSEKQSAANAALRDALLAYDVRHGFRGAEAQVPLPESRDEDELKQLLEAYRPIAGLGAAVVTEVVDQAIKVYSAEHGSVAIDWEGLEWAAPYIDERRVGDPPTNAAEIVKPGDVIRLAQIETGVWRLAQVPAAEGALVSFSPTDGSLLALVGGLDFYRSKFNRALQGERQPGSNFKPFVYSAAISKGYTPATIINDAPVVFDDAGLEDTWRPENYSGKFYGPTRLRRALVLSRNLVSIRVLRATGVKTTLEHAAKFGFDTAKLPHDLSLSLGSGVVTPWQLATGYAVIANGGYKVEPYFIDRIEDRDGELLYAADPMVVCETCDDLIEKLPADEDADTATTVQPSIRIAPRVIDARDNYILRSMMRDVITSGTGRRALSLKRGDIAGKTGTTNDQKDAWFSGFNRDVAATVWVGFDQVKSLGSAETGGRAALPMWIDYMAVALRDSVDRPMEAPPGIITARIDPESGLLARPTNNRAIFEVFRNDNVPELESEPTVPVNDESDGKPQRNRDSQMQLF
jgi:penicillin-binding protein 1A